jgi:hypothetical protein
MSSPAYLTEIYSHGLRVVVTDEPALRLSANKYQITDTTRRLIDPDTEVTVTGLTVTAVDYVQGIVTLATDPAGSIAVDFAYLSKSKIGGSNSYSVELAGGILDSTEFDNGGYRTNVYGLFEVTVTIDRYDDLVQKFKMHKAGGEKVFIEIRIGQGALLLAGWFILETSSSAGDLGSLESESLNFKLASISGPTSYSFSIIEN